MIHGRLARLYDRQGEVAKAINGYRMSIAKGGDGVFPRTRLAHLYLKQGQWRQSAREVWQALKMVPRELGFSGGAGGKQADFSRSTSYENVAPTPSRQQNCFGNPLGIFLVVPARP